MYLYLRDIDMIRSIIKTVTIALCSYIPFTAAQEAADNAISGSIDNGAINVVDTVDAVNTVNAVNHVDTIDMINTVDTVSATKDMAVGKDVINLDDDELLQAALSVDSVKTVPSTQKLDLIRREYEYKRQTRAAIIMMIFIAAAMAMSQSWNPR
jgi:hypothetical protein